MQRQHKSKTVRNTFTAGHLTRKTARTELGERIRRSGVVITVVICGAAGVDVEKQLLISYLSISFVRFLFWDWAGHGPGLGRAPPFLEDAFFVDVGLRKTTLMQRELSCLPPNRARQKSLLLVDSAIQRSFLRCLICTDWCWVP